MYYRLTLMHMHFIQTDRLGVKLILRLLISTDVKNKYKKQT